MADKQDTILLEPYQKLVSLPNPNSEEYKNATIEQYLAFCDSLVQYRDGRYLYEKKYGLEPETDEIFVNWENLIERVELKLDDIVTGKNPCTTPSSLEDFKKECFEYETNVIDFENRILDQKLKAIDEWKENYRDLFNELNEHSLRDDSLHDLLNRFYNNSEDFRRNFNSFCIMAVDSIAKSLTDFEKRLTSLHSFTRLVFSNEYYLRRCNESFSVLYELEKILKYLRENPSLENLNGGYVISLRFLNRLFNHVEEYKSVVNQIIVTNIIIVVLVMLMLALALFLSIFGLDYMDH